MGIAVAGNYIELKTNSGNENLLRQGRRVYMKAGMLGAPVGRLGHTYHPICFGALLFVVVIVISLLF